MQDLLLPYVWTEIDGFSEEISSKVSHVWKRTHLACFIGDRGRPKMTARQLLYRGSPLSSWDHFMLKYASSKEQHISDSKIVKILSRVPHDKWFHFYTGLGQNTGETATSLESFAQALEKTSADSVLFHFQRKDFQNWIQTTVGDGVLAERINHLSGLLPVEDLRRELVEAVQKRISQLRLLHGEMIASQ